MVEGVHTQHEDNPWTIDIVNHASRKDSAEYRRSRTLMGKLVAQVQPWWFGEAPYQDHHGGGIWLLDGTGWMLVFGPAGIEWSAQFCADPAKVDVLRVATQRLVAGFPDTLPGYVELGYQDAGGLLSRPITDADGVQEWTDGIFNASVALPAGIHTGTLPKAGGYHHYPKPIVDIDRFKYDDFILWVHDGQGLPAAVTPVGRRGSGDGRVSVTWAENGSALAQEKEAANAAGDRLILQPEHPIAREAFALQ
jgi:Family of unknown function (DUF6424)